MNTQQSQLDVLFKYLNLFIIRNKLIVLCLLLALSLSYPVYLKSPKIYQSSVSIMFQISNINPSLQPSSARPSPDEGLQIREMVNTVTQKVLSRANLEKIIRQYDLYPEMQKNVPIEDIIANLRKNDISVDVQQRERGNVFSVSFKGAEPQTVMKVANELAAIFIEENLKAREERAQQTATYIQNELLMSKETLQKKESQMRDYKLNYYNEMSEQRASNIARLSDLQRQFQAIQTNIDNREQTRLLLSEQLEIRRDIRSALARPADSNGSDSGRGGLWDRLETARNTRQELLSRYTIEHPSVKRIENQIRQLESEIETLAAAAPNNAIDGDLAFDTRAQDITLQIKEIDIGLKTLRDESENILSQIKTYQEWIDAAPVREAEWSALTRDYDELRRYHDTLLAQSLAAEAAASLERHQKGSQFKVIDPAYLPITPVKGPFRIFFLASAILGLAMGAGLILFFDIIDTSFKDKNEIESFLQIPVTCALPLLVTEAEKRDKKIKDMFWYCFFGVWLLILMATTLYLNRQGVLFL
jgi:polysaccharide chain length determinant protein (PEP-CTERM system associated)